MPYLKNPFGRLVDVDEADYDAWLRQPGFIPATPIEVAEHEEKRTLEVSKWKEEEIRLKANKDKPGVYLVTVSQGGKDGYGVASSKIYKELQKAGVNISMGNTGQKIALLFHAPHSIQRLENQVKIIFTMFESDRLPDEWKQFLEMADKIIVPSQWNKEVFKKAGFPVDVVPLGYDDEVFKFIERTPKRPQRKDFVFLHYNAFNIRKGFTEVFKAFVQEFDPSEPVKMVFKTSLAQAPLPLSPEQYPNIKVIEGGIKEEELVNLLGESDCFVFPSRGEGFGMTPLEAMATGLPTIVPNAHGISEYFNESFMYEVKVKETCPALYHRYKGVDVGKMVICDVDDLRRQMRYIYEHEEEALEKGRAAAQYVKQYTFAKTAEKLKLIIDQLNAKPIIDRPLKNVLHLDALK